MIDADKTALKVYDTLISKYGTVKKAAEAMNVTVKAVYHWKYAEKMPGIDCIVNVADLCGLTVDDLIVRKAV